MPLHLQGSLLRVLQTGDIVRVGGTTPVAVNTRIICATNHPLHELVQAGRFRQDLYYRLSVLPVTVPSLRERDDIEFLAGQLLFRIADRLDSETRGLTRKEMMSLSTYRWPGNVRELENVLTRFIVTGKLPVPATNPLAEPEVDKSPRPLKQRIQSQAIAEIRNALTQSGGNKRRAAELLGISRAHLYRLMKEQGLHSQ